MTTDGTSLGIVVKAVSTSKADVGVPLTTLRFEFLKESSEDSFRTRAVILWPAER